MRQEDESDDDDDDGFLARMTGIGAKHREKRDDKENAHSAYHITFCKAQFEAGQLAVEFNAATERWGRLPRVTFVTPSVYKFAARRRAGRARDDARAGRAAPPRRIQEVHE